MDRTHARHSAGHVFFGTDNITTAFCVARETHSLACKFSTTHKTNEFLEVTFDACIELGPMRNIEEAHEKAMRTLNMNLVSIVVHGPLWLERKIVPAIEILDPLDSKFYRITGSVLYCIK